MLEIILFDEPLRQLVQETSHFFYFFGRNDEIHISIFSFSSPIIKCQGNLERIKVSSLPITAHRYNKTFAVNRNDLLCDNINDLFDVLWAHPNKTMCEMYLKSLITKPLTSDQNQVVAQYPI